MKLSKFVKRAKSESYCVVIHADDSGIWLGTRLALYNATELPYMEGKEQAGAVLDIDSKAWEKMFFDEKYTAHAGADFGMNLTETDPTEQEARRVPLEMFYKGMGLVGLMCGQSWRAKRPAPGELPRARNRPLRWATSCMCGKHGVLTPLERTTGQTGRTALARKWTATTDGTRQFTWERTLREFFCE